MAQLTALLVDWGGVLTNPLSETMDSWCAADGVDPAQFAAVMREWLGSAAATNPVHDLEAGRLSITEFEEHLAARLRTHSGGPLAAAGLVSRMFRGFTTEQSMLDVVSAARGAGLATGLVSNSWGMAYPREGWEQLFDTVVISGEVGLRKPEPEIYRLAARQLGRAESQCVFVDDLPPNVRGAVAVGMVGVRHVDTATTRGELEALFGVDLS